MADREPPPGWTVNRMSHNEEHDFWLIGLIREDDPGAVIALIDDSLDNGWADAVSRAKAYDRWRLTAKDETGPPTA